MSIWLAGLLAVLIVVGSLAVSALVATGIVRFVEAGPATVKKIVEWFFEVFVAICALGTLVGLWYIALSWIMGWPL